jgi:hypothetical protein
MILRGKSNPISDAVATDTLHFFNHGVRIPNLRPSKLIAIEDRAASIHHAHKKTLRVSHNATKILGETMDALQYRDIGLPDEAEHLHEMIEIINASGVSASSSIDVTALA